MQVSFVSTLAGVNPVLVQISTNSPLILNTGEGEDAPLGMGHPQTLCPHIFMEWGLRCLKMSLSMKMKGNPQWTI